MNKIRDIQDKHDCDLSQLKRNVFILKTRTGEKKHIKENYLNARKKMKLPNIEYEKRSIDKQNVSLEMHHRKNSLYLRSIFYRFNQFS